MERETPGQRPRPNYGHPQGAYAQFSADKDGWPGFALGSDEELGIWLLDGTHVASVDWDEGQSPDGQSYARVPDTRRHRRLPNRGQPHPGRRQPALEEDDRRRKFAAR